MVGERPATDYPQSVAERSDTRRVRAYVNSPTERRKVGIVSYGIGCAKQRFAGVYTEVNADSVLGFIQDVASP